MGAGYKTRKNTERRANARLMWQTPKDLAVGEGRVHEEADDSVGPE
jgi:hypothetical protein